LLSAWHSSPVAVYNAAHLIVGPLNWPVSRVSVELSCIGGNSRCPLLPSVHVMAFKRAAFARRHDMLLALTKRVVRALLSFIAALAVSMPIALCILLR
jgi:hypothetical protein